MKKFVRFALVSAALIAPQAASAQVTEQMCGGSGTTLVCTRAKFSLSSGNLQVDFFNGVGSASLVASSVRGIGIYNLTSYGGVWSLNTTANSGGVLDFDAGVSTDVSQNWEMISGFNGLPGVTFNDATADGGNNGNDGLVTCTGPAAGSTDDKTCLGEANPLFTGAQDWLRITFIHTGGTALDAAALTQLDWGWKAQSVGTGSISIECENGSAGDKFCSTTTIPPGGVIESAVTPEPATMSLMAMGLVGMAGAAFRRRRTA